MAGLSIAGALPDDSKLVGALRDILNALDAKRAIWTADMSASRRDRMLASNDAHLRNAEANARDLLAKIEAA